MAVSVSADYGAGTDVICSRTTFRFTITGRPRTRPSRSRAAQAAQVTGASQRHRDIRRITLICGIEYCAPLNHCLTVIWALAKSLADFTTVTVVAVSSTASTSVLPTMIRNARRGARVHVRGRKPREATQR